MSSKLPPEPKAVSDPALAPIPSGLVQTKCACGGSSAKAGGCAECGPKKWPVLQRYSAERAAPDRLLRSLAPPDSHADTKPGLGHNFARLQVHPHKPPGVQTKLSASRPKGPDEAVTRLSATPDSAAQPTTAPSKAQSTAPPEAAGEGAVAAGAASETASPDQASSAGLIAEDDARELGPGQMRKSQFLDELQGSVCAAADAELASVGRTAQGCPYIEKWIGYYRTRGGLQIERAIRRYAPEAVGTATAQGYIPLVAERVRQGVIAWAATGQITGVPEGMASETPEAAPSRAGEGATQGENNNVAGAAQGAEQASSGDTRLALKPRDGEGGDADPSAIQARLGAGRPLDSGVRSRMESAFGHDFSRVRVHTDGHAAGLSERLDARAFTVGRDIAFGSGEYRPGTLIGDALLAHELAHVVQQGGPASSRALARKGEGEYNALEADADESAAQAVVSLWTGMKEGVGDLARHVSPRLKSGLGLQRCGKSCDTTNRCKVKSGPTYTPGGTIAATVAGGRKSAAFGLSAEFEHDPGKGLAACCCEVRQFILWTAAPTPNHDGFKPASSYSVNTWYEDRDDVDKRYGHRTGPHSECIGINHYVDASATEDCKHGRIYQGQDTPSDGIARTGQWQFQLKVIDVCDGGKDVGTAASANVQF